jgi:hypothetical protein
MSFKAHRGSHPEASFDSLPEAVIAHIAYLSKLPRRSRGHPLLRVSRSCRDAVLSSCATIRMYARCQSSTPAPDARLLHRACCQARPGLALWIHLMRFTGSLAELLQPGIECGGWRNVHKLEVGCNQGNTECGQLSDPTEGIRLLLLSVVLSADPHGRTLSSPPHSRLPILMSTPILN